MDRRAGRLDPIIKAYILAYLTSTIPRLPTAIKKILRTKLTLQQKLDLLKSVLTGGIGINRFPTACGLIAAGGTTLPSFLSELLSRSRHLSSNTALRTLLDGFRRRITLICAFLSAWLAFDLLNRDEGWARKRANSRATQEQDHLPRHHLRYAGKTIDFTLFAVCRAFDILVVTTWIRSRGQRFHPERTMPKVSWLVQRMGDAGLFATSAAIIMWSWFYSPQRLPKQYNQWISRMADIDERLINALRLCRQGDFVYYSNSTQDADLPALCQELGLPQVWGDPSKTAPIPCELYHCGAGKSCEVHAAKRFLNTFRFAMRLYVPLQLVGLLRRSSMHRPRVVSLLKDAARSSSFLAAFVGFFYYAVCLARTRLGPRIFSTKMVTAQMWDAGLCVLTGCLACGWSIMFEKPGRRQEMAFFVAPRALATLMPRVYDRQHQRREQVAFAASVAVVMEAMSRKEHHVRGVFGKILEGVLG